MSRVVKINLNGGLKRLVSTLICVMMVLATFPMHMLKNTVSADEGVSIDLTLSSGDGSEVTNWMASEGALADADTVKSAGDINIKLTNNIEVASGASPLPTMTTGGGKKYFFDFTDGRFDGKTITIDGQGKIINIDNARLFFLNLQNCRVILKNITIDGGWIKDGDGGTKRLASFIYVLQPDSGKSSELEIEEGTTIQNCKNSMGFGGAIYNRGGTVTINGGNITSCTSSFGGAIYNNKGTVTINDINISDCKVSGNKNTHGGAIDNNAGKLIINGGSITNCTSQHYGDAIYNHETLNISEAISGLFKIELPGDHGKGNCNHNDDPDKVGGYDGIYNAKAAEITSVSNYKIDFVDSSDGSTVGFVFGKSDDEISVPYSVSNRPEYVLTGLSYIKTGESERTPIDVNEGKFKLNDDMLSAANNRVITVYVNYEKPYTVQYFCSNKVVGTKSGCSSETLLSGIIGADFSQISLDGEDRPTLDVAVGDATLQEKGYTFSNFTYGTNNTAVVLEASGGQTATTWQQLKDSAVNGVITVCVNYNKPYTVQYICDGKVVGRKSGCSAGTNLGTIINTDFSQISLDGSQKLDVAVGDATLQEKGYTFSKFTYGDGQTYTNSTTWGNLKASAVDNVITIILNYTDGGTVKYVASGHMILDKKSKPTNYSGVNLPVSGLQKAPEPKKIIFDFCGQTIHHNDPNVPFIQGVPGKSITICNLHMDGSGCK